MASQLTKAIDQFLTLHPEYRNNDFWISGESYAGKYIPNLAQYIDQNLSTYKINLKGVMIGNGQYYPELQYTTVGDFAYDEGLIDEITYNKVQAELQTCVSMIKNGKFAESMDFCENIVAEIYDNTSGAFR